MKTNQWVAVVVSIVVIFGFFYYFLSSKKPSMNINEQNNNNEVKEVVNNDNANTNLAKQGSVVTVNYVGKLEDGTVFDTSANHGPIKFTLGIGQVIQGWDEGLIGMKVGETKHLVIPPEKGYGSQGFPPIIPANATLTFDVEIVDVQN
ncbi:MAG: FKBP-type peptidyl-prolyl cis-trans isomerase [Patescibacteria group bacterium]|nr:FKBP-type peptidyl-prolyl cis-trans isomerase [Patescibacteria group bacterium]